VELYLFLTIGRIGVVSRSSIEDGGDKLYFYIFDNTTPLSPFIYFLLLKVSS